MKTLDPSYLDSLHLKLENVDLLTLQIMSKRGQVSRQEMILYQSALNMLICDATITMQQILQSQFREEDKHG